MADTNDTGTSDTDTSHIDTNGTGTNDTDTNGTPGYAAALGELDAILRELEASDVDVDHLAERVSRAAELIALCREKISSAQIRIEEVTAELDG